MTVYAYNPDTLGSHNCIAKSQNKNPKQEKHRLAWNLDREAEEVSHYGNSKTKLTKQNAVYFIHRETHPHTYSYTLTHTHIHTYTLTYAHTLTLIHTLAYTHTHTIHTHTLTHTHSHTLSLGTDKILEKYHLWVPTTNLSLDMLSL